MTGTKKTVFVKDSFYTNTIKEYVKNEFPEEAEITSDEENADVRIKSGRDLLLEGRPSGNGKVIAVSMMPEFLDDTITAGIADEGIDKHEILAKTQAAKSFFSKYLSKVVYNLNLIRNFSLTCF